MGMQAVGRGPWRVRQWVGVHGARQWVGIHGARQWVGIHGARQWVGVWAGASTARVQPYRTLASQSPLVLSSSSRPATHIESTVAGIGLCSKLIKICTPGGTWRSGTGVGGGGLLLWSADVSLLTACAHLLHVTQRVGDAVQLEEIEISVVGDIRLDGRPP